MSTNSGGPRPPLKVAQEIFATRGLAGFYTGCGAVIAGNALKSATRFFTYESIKNMLPRKEGGKLSPLSNLLAGTGAGCIEAIVAVTPTETIKTRMIEMSSGGVGVVVTANGTATATLAKPPGTFAVVGHILHTEGIRGLYRGLVPTMMKQSANSAVRFSTYEALKHSATTYNNGAPLNTPSIMLIGGLTGLVTVYATMPFDVVKTRMQQAGNRYRNSLDCFVQSLKADGPTVFWRGSSPRVIRLIIAGTVSFSIYERVLRALKAM